MASNHGILLATHLISSHFGELVSKVCECLLRKGTLPFKDIQRYTELSEDNVSKCLRVLIHHNCVQAFTEEIQGAFGKKNKHLVQYMALFYNILHRMRFAKFMEIVSKKLGKKCEEVFERLIQHGRLTLEQVLSRDEPTENDGSLPDPVRENFIKLVNAHYVERCPKPEPFLELPTDEFIAKKRGPRSKIYEIEESIEQRAIAAASHMDSKRFLLVTNTETDVSENNNDDYSYTVAKGKRKHDAIEMGRDSEDSNYEKEVLWRVNFEEFTRCLRHKAIIANVRSRLDDGAAMVCEAILEATRNMEFKVKTESSAPLSLNTIHEEVMNNAKGCRMTLEHVRASLDQLECRSGGNEKLYSLGLKRIIEQAQTEEVDLIVLKRHGMEACRIFRLLTKNPHFHETDQISDKTFVDKKVTTKILYDLWKAGYLCNEKVLVSAQRQLNFLLWKVNLDTLRKNMVEEMYHAALNLSERGAFELEQGNELINLPRDRLDADQIKKISRLSKVKKLLDSSLIKLDDALMLFHDF